MSGLAVKATPGAHQQSKRCYGGAIAALIWIKPGCSRSGDLKRHLTGYVRDFALSMYPHRPLAQFIQAVM